jgi:hypothetical protein
LLKARAHCNKISTPTIFHQFEVTIARTKVIDRCYCDKVEKVPENWIDRENAQRNEVTNRSVKLICDYEERLKLTDRQNKSQNRVDRLIPWEWTSVLVSSTLSCIVWHYHVSDNFATKVVQILLHYLKLFSYL